MKIERLFTFQRADSASIYITKIFFLSYLFSPPSPLPHLYLFLLESLWCQQRNEELLQADEKWHCKAGGNIPPTDWSRMHAKALTTGERLKPRENLPIWQRKMSWIIFTPSKGNLVSMLSLIAVACWQIFSSWCTTAW